MQIDKVVEIVIQEDLEEIEQGDVDPPVEGFHVAMVEQVDVVDFDLETVVRIMVDVVLVILAGNLAIGRTNALTATEDDTKVDRGVEDVNKVGVLLGT